MPTIKARVGSQNTVRVLSNASSPPTRLTNLADINTDLKTQDGMILVWDLPTQTFIMTGVIDSSSTTIGGISYFTKLFYYINLLKFEGYRLLYSHA